MLADGPGVDCLAARLALAEIEPGVRFERDQPIFANPGQAVERSSAIQNEAVVRVIEQYCRQAGDRLVEWYGG